MKLASLKSSGRDGELVVVSSDNRRAVKPGLAHTSTLLEALRHWPAVVDKLKSISQQLNAGKVEGEFTFQYGDCVAPLPNAAGFYDGSAFLSHVVRARRARGDQMPESAKVTPLMYQGVSDALLGGSTPLEIQDPAFGGDFEGEFGVITMDTPRACPSSKVSSYFALFTMFNDITLREIVKVEIETKFGFLQSKPNSSFAPLVVTADELGEAWDGKRIHLDLKTELNGQVFGRPNGSEMHFTFSDLVAHACRTRPLSAGSIVGSGTVSNEDKARGFTCLTEKRFQEILDQGKPVTPWLKEGDRVRMNVEYRGVSVFGPIDQIVAVSQFDR